MLSEESNISGKGTFQVFKSMGSKREFAPHRAIGLG
jgi:hypothetical protein